MVWKKHRQNAMKFSLFGSFLAVFWQKVADIKIIVVYICVVLSKP